MFKRGKPMNEVRRLSISLAVASVLLHFSNVGLGASTVFFEDFDDGVANRFVEADGTWSVVDGSYVQSTTNPPGPYRSYVSALGEYVMDVDFILLSGQEVKVIYAHADVGEDYRVDFWPTYSRLTMPEWGQPWNSREFIAAVNLAYNTTYRVRIEVYLGEVIVWLNDVPVHNQAWANGVPLGDGKVGVGTWSATARFDNFVVSSISGGAVLFEENFDDGRADRFTEVGDTWDVDGGSYLQFAESPAGPYRSWVAALWRYVIQFDYTPLSIGETKVIYAHADTGEEYRVDFWLNNSRLCIPEWGQAWQTRATTLGGLSLLSYRTNRVRVEVNQAGVKVWLNGELRHDEPWANSYPLGDGVIGVGTYANATRFDNLSVRTLTEPSGRTWYVVGSVSQSGNGTSWHEAFKTIQEGINAAANGDVVIVATGTYYENVHFLAKNITLRSTDPLDPAVVNATIINGRAYGSVVTCQGEENEGCILSGFTITNGKSPYGGGVLGHDASLTIRHNVIFDNWGDVGGGLAFCNGRIENNTISNNKAIGHWPAGCGGGLYQCNGPIRNNVIASNTADSDGGGLGKCGGLLQGNTIQGNSAEYGGGLAFCDGPIVENSVTANSCTLNGAGFFNCYGEIRGNIIAQNSAGEEGGGLVACGGPILDNIIRENSAVKWAGGLGMCSGPIRNNLVVGNTAGLAGGGLDRCDGEIDNNVIVGNSTQNGGGLCLCFGTVTNCIIWGNKASPGLGPQIWESTGHTTLIHCCIQDWTGGGDGVITSDPQFVDADGGDNNPDTFADNDYRLKARSPCIDAGKNLPWMWGALDLDGNNRIFFGGNSKNVDMGAYEYNSFPFKIVEVNRAPRGQLHLKWASRPAETYDLWSWTPFQAASWSYEATVSSQGTLTSWTGSSTSPQQRFYVVELR
jgi:hypothetical protein